MLCFHIKYSAAAEGAVHPRSRQVRRRTLPANIRIHVLVHIKVSDIGILQETMASKLKEPTDCSNKTYSVCESTADSSSRVEEDGESDGPAVFMCGKCKLPIGDSLSWAGSDDERNQIMLKRKRCRMFTRTFSCSEHNEAIHLGDNNGSAVCNDTMVQHQRY